MSHSNPRGRTAARLNGVCGTRQRNDVARVDSDLLTREWQCARSNATALTDRLTPSLPLEAPLPFLFFLSLSVSVRASRRRASKGRSTRAAEQQQQEQEEEERRGATNKHKHQHHQERSSPSRPPPPPSACLSLSFGNRSQPTNQRALLLLLLQQHQRGDRLREIEHKREVEEEVVGVRKALVGSRRRGRVL